MAAAASSSSSWSRALQLPSKPVAAGAAQATRKKKAGAPPQQQNDEARRAPGFSRAAKFQSAAIEFRAGLGERGGGRGYVAVRDIQPGELLLQEVPCADIPPTPPERNPAERCLIHLASGSVPLDTAKRALADMAMLHPQSLADVSEQCLKDLRELYRDFAGEMRGLPNGEALGLHEPDVLLRHVCALHFNGFETGVYLHLAMANHSCAPNSVKWGVREGVNHSEVRATRVIKSGEEICFSYLVPTLRSREARKRALNGQFQFTCMCDLCEQVNGFDPRLEEGPPSVANQLELCLESIEESGRVAYDARGALKDINDARAKARAEGLGVRSLAIAHADAFAVECCLELLQDATMGEEEAEADDAEDAGQTDQAKRPVKKTPAMVKKAEENLVLTMLNRSLSIRKTQNILFRVGRSADGGGGAETRDEAEQTLHHIVSGIQYLLAMGAKGEKLLTILRDDETGEQLFANARDAETCCTVADQVGFSIAKYYD